MQEIPEAPQPPQQYIRHISSDLQSRFYTSIFAWISLSLILTLISLAIIVTLLGTIDTTFFDQPLFFGLYLTITPALIVLMEMGFKHFSLYVNLFLYILVIICLSFLFVIISALFDSIFFFYLLSLLAITFSIMSIYGFVFKANPLTPKNILVFLGVGLGIATLLNAIMTVSTFFWYMSYIIIPFTTVVIIIEKHNFREMSFKLEEDKDIANKSLHAAFSVVFIIYHIIILIALSTRRRRPSLFRRF